ncbi:PEP-CTERM sorting domain-containing protein [Aphanothece sacrum]|nr:PEP-CTERM sorting domain-containing protein [Aphanothece sacrum]
MLSAVSGVGTAQAGILTPPPPDSTAAFSPVVNVGASGVRVKFLAASTCPVVGFAGVCDASGGANDGSLVPEVSTFDFLPPSGSGYGEFKVDNSQPDPTNSFSSARGGRIKDFVLPFLGQGERLNLNLPVNITAFLDFDPTGGDAVMDTFDATTLTSVVFQSTSPNSAVAQFSFNGIYHIDGQTFSGTVNISQPISGIDALEVIRRARRTNGFLTSYSGQTTVVPEPLTMLGAGAAFGFGSFFKRKISKTKKGDKAA